MQVVEVTLFLVIRENLNKYRLKSAHNEPSLSSSNISVSMAYCNSALYVVNDVMRPLSESEQIMIEKTLHGKANSNDNIVAKQGNNVIHEGSIKRLQTPKTKQEGGIESDYWLNDECINFYLKSFLTICDKELCLIDSQRRRSHFYSSYFMEKIMDKSSTKCYDGEYCYENVKGWSDKIEGGNIFDLEYVFFPINNCNVHWTLIVVCIQCRQIKYFDSKGETKLKWLECIKQYMIDESNLKYGNNSVNTTWTLVKCPTDIPLQQNGKCVFVF